jgi:hypothetical protein
MSVAIGRCAWTVIVVVSTVILGCGGTGTGPGLSAGDDAGRGTGGAFAGGDASGVGALDAYVEQGDVQVTFVTLSCNGDCVTVKAVATGGHPPYTFAWDDGSTNSTRQVCPEADTSYRVKVMDTATVGEFPRPAQTAQAPLNANVLACPDGGSAEGGPGPSGGLCLSNPSFEGTAGPTIEQIVAAPWLSCLTGLSYANIWSAGEPAGLAPTDGSTYLRLGTLGGEPRLSSVSEPICAPIQASATYSLTLDMAFESSDSTVPSSLEIWSGSSSCSLGELLWTSSPVTGTSWTTYCATLTPTQDATYLTFAASVPMSVTGNTSGLYIDHLVPVAKCP